MLKFFANKYFTVSNARYEILMPVLYGVFLIGILGLEHHIDHIILAFKDSNPYYNYRYSEMLIIFGFWTILAICCDSIFRTTSFDLKPTLIVNLKMLVGTLILSLPLSFAVNVFLNIAPDVWRWRFARNPLTILFLAGTVLLLLGMLLFFLKSRLQSPATVGLSMFQSCVCIAPFLIIFIVISLDKEFGYKTLLLLVSVFEVLEYLKYKR